MAGVRARGWRSAFAVLHTSPVEIDLAVQELLNQAPGLARAAADLPVQEISEDLVRLVEIIYTHWNLHRGAEAVDVCSKTCRLLQDVGSHIQLELSSSSAVGISRFLRQILEWHNLASNEMLYFEALNLLAQFVHTNAQQLSLDELNALVDSLVPHMSWQPLEGKGTRKGGILDCRQAVFVAVGNIFSRYGSSISKSVSHSVIQAFRRSLDSYGPGNPLAEDFVASRFYAALLRSLLLVVSDVKIALDEYVAGFVASLRFFFAYGLSGNFQRRVTEVCRDDDSRTQEVSESSKGSSLYRPPHLRHKNITSFSDSEHSDSDVSSGEIDHYKSSKARNNALLVIQAIARVDPKLLHAHWSLLLPTHNTLQPSLYQPNLLSVLLFDPAFKTRIAAASTICSLLEGPTRAFLQVADYREAGKTGSFTTLSSSLGQMIVQLHGGLIRVIASESHSGMLVATLKALSLLVSAAPFERLPADILPHVISSVHQKMTELSTCPDHTNTTVAALTCICAALSVSTISPQLSSLVATEQQLYSEDSRSSNNWRKSLVLDLIYYAKSSSSLTVSIEALQALKAAFHVHGSLLSHYWSAISEMVLEILESEYSSQAREYSSSDRNRRHVDDKVVFHAMKALDEFLRAISGFKVAEDSLNDIPVLPPPPSLLPQPAKLLQRPTPMTTTHNNTPWLEALEKHIPRTLNHKIPMVRAAALTCFAGLTQSAYSSLPQVNQAMIFSTVLNAAGRDETPSVRSAACRSLGVLVEFNEICGSGKNISAAITRVQSTIADTSLSVRITSSWALANICDALRKSSEVGSESVCTDAYSLNILAESALRAAKDGDKVRANAVRALGNLARFVDFSSEKILSDSKNLVDSAPCAWLGKMVQTLVSCITTGNVKVQWNVCHALGNLFLNKSISLQNMPWSLSVYSILLLLLRDSANFKIRIHAASALGVPCSREDYGESYVDVVQALVNAVESQNGERGTTPSSFKYVATLSQQLSLTTIHVLSIARHEDGLMLKDFLQKKEAFLQHWLQSCRWNDDDDDDDDGDGHDDDDDVLTFNKKTSNNNDEVPLPQPKQFRLAKTSSRSTSSSAVACKVDEAIRLVASLCSWKL